MKKFLLGLVAVAMLLGSTSTADAAFRLRIEDVTAGVGMVVTDNGVGDAAGAVDIISVSGTVGAFSFTITTGLASPGVPFAGFYDGMDVGGTFVASGAGTLRIILEKDGFAAAPDGGLGLYSGASGTLATGAGSTATFTSWANDGDLVPALGPDTFPTAGLPALGAIPAGSVAAGPQVFVTPPVAFAGENTVAFTKTGTYSMFSSAVFVAVGAGSGSFDHQTGTLPAPGGLILLAAGLPCLAAYYRRKKAAVQA
jgi:hypothetical protein